MRFDYLQQFIYEYISNKLNSMPSILSVFPPSCPCIISAMVCCAAWGCSNCSEKGVRMFGFPTGMERRKKMAGSSQQEQS